MLLEQIDTQMKKTNKYADILVVDDCSKKKKIKIKKLSNIRTIDIISLKKNLGSQKAICIGLKYLKKIKKKTIITVLDSDGEDDSSRIPAMIKTAEKNLDKVIVSSRIRRRENFIFKILYFIHKCITFVFTLNWISFGNYSSFQSSNIDKILKNNSSWLAFSATVTKNCKIIRLYAERKKRFFGNSKLSFMGLINHSIRVNSVFMKKILFISTIYIVIFFNLALSNRMFICLIIFSIILFNLCVFTTFLLNKPSDYHNSTTFIKKVKKIY